MNAFLAGLTILGFLITAGGVVSAYVGARRDFRDADARIEDSKQMAALEEAEMAARTREQSASAEFSDEIHSRYEKLYAARDLVRPSYDSLVYMPAYESRRLLGIVLDSARANLVISGAGLFLSTMAGVAGLLLAPAT